MKKLVVTLILLFHSICYAWEPTQAPAKKISLEYELFPPFNNSTINLSVNNSGYIDKLEIYTNVNSINLNPKELKLYRYPSLPDIEIMHYGEYDQESGLGGNFSLCIPYGPIQEVKSDGDEHWQRAVLVVYVDKNKHKINNIPLPTAKLTYGGMNGCEISAQEIFGF